MSPKTKKILLIVSFLVATAILTYGLYFILFRPDLQGPPTTAPPTSDQGDPGALPGSGDFSDDRVPQPGDGITDEDGDGLPDASPIAQGGPTQVRQLTTAEVLAPTPSGSRNARFYDPNDGLFYDVNSNGELEPISTTSFPEAENVTFDNQGQKAILEFPDGSNIIYDISANRQITMPNHWEEFDFSPDGTQIAAKSITGQESGQLIALTSDGSRAAVVADMGQNANKVDVSWSPNDNFIALSETGPALAGFGRRSYLLIDKQGQSPSSIIADGQNFSSEWSPNGSHLVYSTTDLNNRDRPSLWSVKASGQDIGSERKKIDVETWIEKCTFRNNSVMLCAVPREIEDYQDFDYRFNESIDDLFEVNLLTGRSTLIAESIQNMRMYDLSVSNDGSQVFFTDQLGRLNSIQLR